MDADELGRVAPAGPDRARETAVATAPEIDGWIAEYQAMRDPDAATALIKAFTPLADYFARRYARPGTSREDLRQTALLAILRAVDRFDATMGVQFTTFASRTVEGELKRFHRDRGWAVRPPRRLQEIYLSARAAEEDLTHRLGRAPTVDEVAAEIEETVEQVLEALEAGYSCRSTTTRTPDDHRPEPTTGPGVRRPMQVVTDGPDAFELSEQRVLLGHALGHLSEKERELVRLRFVEDLTQKEIADQLGLSQSYLSRVLRRLLERLHDELEDPEAVLDRPA
jgi:RNA polymerase sigma-B factor